MHTPIRWLHEIFPIDEVFARDLKIDLASLHNLNPAFLSPAFDESVYLPKGSTIRVPWGEGNRTITSIYNLAR